MSPPEPDFYCLDNECKDPTSEEPCEGHLRPTVEEELAIAQYVGESEGL